MLILWILCSLQSSVGKGDPTTLCVQFENNKPGTSGYFSTQSLKVKLFSRVHEDTTARQHEPASIGENIAPLVKDA